MCRMYSPVVNFNAPLNTQFVRLITFYLCLPTVGPYWLRFGAQTSQSALGKKKTEQGDKAIAARIRGECSKNTGRMRRESNTYELVSSRK